MVKICNHIEELDLLGYLRKEGPIVDPATNKIKQDRPYKFDIWYFCRSCQKVIYYNNKIENVQ